MGFDSIITRVNSLPPLPESVQKIQALFAQGEPEIRKLVKIVEGDPLLTADILKLVNSPLYSFSKNVVSVLQASTLFGMAPLRGFILSSSVNSTLDLDMSVYGVSNDTFKEVSALQSSLMFQWYMGIDVARSSILVPISFLMEMGKVIIAQEVSQSDYSEQFTQMIDENGLTETEKIFTDMSTADVNAVLFKQWNFNDIFVNSMKYLDDPLSAPQEYAPFVEALDVVRTCVNMQDIISEKSFKEAKNKVMMYDLPLDRFIHTVERLAEKR